MKHMKTTVMLAALVTGMPLLPLLAQNTGKAPAASPMVMGAMMETCQKRCETMMGTMAELTKTLDGVKASNNAAKLHEALDQVQTTMAGMQTQAKDCNSMMEHIHQMMDSASH
jgi:hypothetical protein